MVAYHQRGRHQRAVSQLPLAINRHVQPEAGRTRAAGQISAYQANNARSLTPSSECTLFARAASVTRTQLV